MSLINDALKRARDTQPKSEAPASGPSMRPVDAARRNERPDLLLPLLVGVILLLAAALFGLWWHGEIGVVTVRAKSLPETAQPVQWTKLPQPTSAIVQPIAGTPKSIIVSNATNDAKGTNAAVMATPTNAVSTNMVAAMEPPKPAPVTYKLQSLFYTPRSPSAVINGKTVFPGSKVGDARVVAIGKESATLITPNGQYIFLELL